jgi:protein-disulfide isomerase
MRLSLVTLGLCLSMSVSAGAEGLTDMTAAEKDAFNQAVRAYLLENPEVLEEAINVLNDRRAAAEGQADQQMVVDYADQIFNDGHSWVGGNPDGDVTVVEFMDYRCGYCKKASAEVEELVASDGNIRLIFKEFPILGEDSVTASRFAVAVQQLHGPEAYKAAHDALITLRGAPDEATLSRLAADLGHDPAAILLKMNTDEVTSVIAANHALAEALQVSGTPTFVIDGQMLRGYLPLDDMRQIVADERAG